jgi:hypothetical protein
VSEQVGVEKDVRDVAGDVGADAAAIEQCARESAEVVGAKAARLLCGGIHAGIIEKARLTARGQSTTILTHRFNPSFPTWLPRR